MHSVGFIGAGQMAGALAGGWRAAGLLDLPRCLGCAPSAASREKFTARSGVHAVAELAEVVAATEIVLLAVKPGLFPEVMAQVALRLRPGQLVVSVAAGVTIAQLTTGLGTSIPIVRTMPNTPCLVGAGATGFTAGPGVTAAQRETVFGLFSAVGYAVELPEPLLDALTGLSGSGPAYAFVMIEALADGGVRAGLPRPVAQRLAAQTVLGAAQMVLHTGEHPAALKDAVASPGGTTIHGLHALERGGVRVALIDAVLASARRAAHPGSPLAQGTPL